MPGEEKNLAGQLAEKDAELARFREEQKKKDDALQAKDAELARFREEQKQKDEELKAKDAEIVRFRQESERKDIISFLDGQVKAGNALPAWREAGLVEFMESLGVAGEESLAKFSEKESQPVSQRDWMKKFLGSITGIVTFREIITSGKAPEGQGNGDAGARIHELTVRKMQEQKDMNYRQALNEVQRENPTLTMKYLESAQPAN